MRNIQHGLEIPAKEQRMYLEKQDYIKLLLNLGLFYINLCSSSGTFTTWSISK